MNATVTQKERYFRRIAHLQTQGLRDVSFYVTTTFDGTEEEIYGELNRLHEAPDLPDRQVLGKYSPFSTVDTRRRFCQNSRMSDLAKSYLAAAVRFLLTAFAAFLAKHGIDASHSSGLLALINPEAIAGALVAAGSLVWSLYHKASTNTKLVVAAATGLTSATPTVADVAKVAGADRVAPAPPMPPGMTT